MIVDDGKQKVLLNMKILEHLPDDRILPEQWCLSIKKDVLEAHNETVVKLYAMSIAGQVSLPSDCGYSIIDMAFCIPPLTAGQAMVFFKILLAMNDCAVPDDAKCGVN